LQTRARAVRPPLNIRGQRVADGIVEVATTLPARVEPAPAGARGGQEPVETESTDELARKINCSTSAEKPPLDQPSQLLEPSHKKARTDHTPMAGEHQLMHLARFCRSLRFCGSWAEDHRIGRACRRRRRSSLSPAQKLSLAT